MKARQCRFIKFRPYLPFTRIPNCTYEKNCYHLFCFAPLDFFHMPRFLQHFKVNTWDLTNRETMLT